ncbi:MAG TPA: hypothetical protein VKZ50_06725 [bacterium]|nr:hypothetical protein [bacterium]
MEPDRAHPAEIVSGADAQAELREGAMAIPTDYTGLEARGAVAPAAQAIPKDRDSMASWFLRRGALRVPEITVYFWIVKGLSTAIGESTSDYSVHVINPYIAVILGFIFFVVAIIFQFRMARYNAWTYWSAVVMVGVFGTMCADVLHVVIGVPYIVSTILFATILAVLFIAWGRMELTLSIHAIDTPRREAFYWAVVVATFAMGTAIGDMTAYTLHLGYFKSLALFALLFAVPIVGGRLLHLNEVFTFWFAYVLTRPLGASFADALGKPTSFGGMGWGAGHVSVALTVIIAVLVAYLARTQLEVQLSSSASSGREGFAAWSEPVIRLLADDQPSTEATTHGASEEVSG